MLHLQAVSQASSPILAVSASFPLLGQWCTAEIPDANSTVPDGFGSRIDQ
jgi:hypothetical protein